MAIDLLKKKVGIILEKRKLPQVTCEVKFALDISGSMQSLYDNGTVQNLTDRLLAIAARFDDDGAMQVWTFTNGFDEAPEINESMHEGYVNKHILNNHRISKWGGTSYAPVMQDIINQSFTEEKIVKSAIEEKPGFLGKLFGSKPNVTAIESSERVNRDPKFPIFVPFVTDGDNSDHANTERLIQEFANKNIYWMMVGIGSEKFTWLKNIADKYPNVGFEKFEDLQTISDEDFYSKLLNEEFCNWVKKFA
jgi:hypothetical protein